MGHQIELSWQEFRHTSMVRASPTVVLAERNRTVAAPCGRPASQGLEHTGAPQQISDRRNQQESDCQLQFF
jgi:hypothetical protein